VDILFSFDVCLCVCVCVHAVDWSKWFKMVKATDIKFDMHVSRDSPDSLKIFRKGCV